MILIQFSVLRKREIARFIIAVELVADLKSRPSDSQSTEVISAILGTILVVEMGESGLTLEELSPWIEFQFTRSSGPGGQNVNKVNSRVILLFDFSSCNLLTPGQKARIQSRLASRLAHDGRLRITHSAERTQLRNRAAAQARLLMLLGEALRSRKTRRATKPTAASRRRRLDDKRRRGETITRRKPAPPID